MTLIAAGASVGIVALAIAAALIGRRRLLRAGLPRLSAVLVRNPGVVTTSRDGEMVISLTGQDEALALDQVAGRCWELTTGTRPVWRIGRMLSSSCKIPLAEAIGEVRSFSRGLKLALLAMEPSEWELIHIHRDGLFSGCSSEGIVESLREDGLIIHAARCLEGTDGIIRPWGGTWRERRRGAGAMRVHRAQEQVLEKAAVEFKRGWDSCSAGRLEEARAAFERSVRKAPRWANALYQLGYVCLRLQDYETARENLEQAEALSPGFYMVREYLDQAIRLAAGDLSQEAFLLLDKANAAGLKDPDATIRLARQALEISPKFPSARLILARAYEKKELLHMALEELAHTIQMNPDKATLCHALLSRGSIFMAQGRAEHAIREWTQVIRLDGSATATRTALANLASAGCVH